MGGNPLPLGGGKSFMILYKELPIRGFFSRAYEKVKG